MNKFSTTAVDKRLLTMIVDWNSCLLVYRWDYKRTTKYHFAISQFLRFSKKLRFEIHVWHANRLSRFKITNRFNTNRQWNESHDRLSTIKKIQFCATNWSRSLFERETFTSKTEVTATNFSKSKTFYRQRQKKFLYDHYRQVYQAHRNLKRRHEKILLTKIKKKYKKKQSMIDIQRQLKKLSMTKQKILQTIKYVFEKKIHVIDAFFTFVTSSIEKKCQRRITTINALIVLCKKQKNQNFRHRKANIKFKKKQISVLSSSNLSKTFSIECKTTQCIFCLKNENLSIFDRLKTFASRDDFKKYFHRKHLRHHFEDQSIVCFHFRCDVILNDAMHLQNYVEIMHKTRTWLFKNFYERFFWRRFNSINSVILL